MQCLYREVLFCLSIDKDKRSTHLTPPHHTSRERERRAFVHQDPRGAFERAHLTHSPHGDLGAQEASALSPPARRAGRFAPTPTGALHLGNASTALLAHLCARALGHASLLRIDDLDPRATPAGCLEGQLEDLEWLGLRYDEGPREGGPCGPYAQSARGGRYALALERLNARGLLYLCACSRKELAALAPHAGEEGAPYPGRCRPALPPRLRPPLDLSALTAPLLRGAPAPLAPELLGGALRLDLEGAVAEGLLPRALTLRDEVAGEGRYDLTGQVGDFVVCRRDGVFAYQLACAVDDVSQGCEVVVRGEDLLTSTARQRALLCCLGLPLESHPRYAHVALIVDAGGERLAKRRESTQLRGLRAAGVSPAEVRRALAEAWGAPPTGDLDLLTEWCALSRLPRGAVRLPGWLRVGSG